MPSISGINPISPPTPVGPLEKPAGAGEKDFSSFFSDAIGQVEGYRMQAENSANRFMAGEPEELHQVILAGVPEDVELGGRVVRQGAPAEAALGDRDLDGLIGRIQRLRIDRQPADQRVGDGVGGAIGAQVDDRLAPEDGHAADGLLHADMGEVKLVGAELHDRFEGRR